MKILLLSLLIFSASVQAADDDPALELFGALMLSTKSCIYDIAVTNTQNTFACQSAFYLTPEQAATVVKPTTPLDRRLWREYLELQKKLRSMVEVY